MIFLQEFHRNSRWNFRRKKKSNEIPKSIPERVSGENSQVQKTRDQFQKNIQKKCPGKISKISES